MPISLPPIPRRQFLVRSIVAGAALFLPHRLFAASSPDPNTWALLADTHIAADRKTIARGVNMTENLSAVGRELAGMDQRPGGVFVVGDLAYSSGESKDYQTLIELLAPLRKSELPVHLALGNHDHRERFREALLKEKPEVSPVTDRHVMLVKTPRANWFVLDSLEKTLSTPGMLGSEQLHWLAKSLDENPGKPALILVHHNPGLMDNVGLKDTENLFKVLRPRKQVKAYIFGHTHNWSVTRDESGIHLINLPPVAYVFRPENPNGWIKATLLENGMSLEMRCIDPVHKAQGHLTELEWRS